MRRLCRGSVGRADGGARALVERRGGAVGGALDEEAQKRERRPRRDRAEVDVRLERLADRGALGEVRGRVGHRRHRRGTAIRRHLEKRHHLLDISTLILRQYADRIAR